MRMFCGFVLVVGCVVCFWLRACGCGVGGSSGGSFGGVAGGMI